MLESITWKTYLSAVLIAVISYYLIILLVYYRKQLKSMILHGHIEQEPEEVIEGGFKELEELTEDIRYSILEEAGKDASKAELLVQFRQRLADYGGLRRPAFRVALTNFLIQKSDSICGITFTEQELNQEWDKLTRAK